jgi:exopolysaccharide biosynthesis polyprenyl glycosylphosphotransferase
VSKPLAGEGISRPFAEDPRDISGPRKESCLDPSVSSPSWSVPVEGYGGAVKSRRSPLLRLRDKALPDRLVIASVACDALVVTYALIFGFWLRFYKAVPEAGIGVAHLSTYSVHIALGALSLMLLLTNLGIYERNALLRFRFVSLQVLRASALWSTGFVAVMAILRFQPPISLYYAVIAAVVTPVALLTWRWLFHSYLGRSSVAVNLQQRLLFIGWNKDCLRLLDHFTHEKVSAYEIVGCLQPPRSRFQQTPPVKVLGLLPDLVQVIHESAIDMVVLTDVNCVRGEIVTIANTCERELVQFKVVPSYFQILVSGLHLETISGIPILGVSGLPLDRFINILLKRAVDVAGSIIGLILSAPLMFVFGMMVRMESPGPVFYRQRRLGRHGVEFDILKIRSMRLDAEAPGKVGWSIADDPRRLRIGTFMRRFNIDEIPQFWNVFKGEMSLVGPRPERPELIKSFKHEIPHYNARHNAKPGITGWAQVNGFRGDTDLNERVKYDLWYLENWNPVLDFQIMFMTFVRNKNAA